MNKNKIIKSYIYKKIKAFNRLNAVCAEPDFVLKTIEIGEIDEVAIFFDNITGKHRMMSISNLFHNKNLLCSFNSQDACSIGYAYGRIMSRKGGCLI